MCRRSRAMHPLWYLPLRPPGVCLFFFNDTATTEIYTLSLHDALPIFAVRRDRREPGRGPLFPGAPVQDRARDGEPRSEEHTSELQSLTNLVCRLLLEKKKAAVQRRRSALAGRLAFSGAYSRNCSSYFS